MRKALLVLAVCTAALAAAVPMSAGSTPRPSAPPPCRYDTSRQRDDVCHTRQAAAPDQCVGKPGSTQPSPDCGGAQVCNFDFWFGVGQGYVQLCGYNNWDYALISTHGVFNAGGVCGASPGANVFMTFTNWGAFNFCVHDYTNYQLHGFKEYTNLKGIYLGTGTAVHVWGFATT